MRRLYNWLLKLCGKHVCEEWTQWETREQKFQRMPRNCQEEYWCTVTSTVRITFTKRWQERRCTLCGKIEQRELEF